MVHGDTVGVSVGVSVAVAVDDGDDTESGNFVISCYKIYLEVQKY